MNTKALALLDKMARAKKLAEKGYTRWHQMEVSDSKTGRKHYDQYVRYTEKYDEAEKELRTLLSLMPASRPNQGLASVIS